MVSRGRSWSICTWQWACGSHTNVSPRCWRAFMMRLWRVASFRQLSNLCQCTCGGIWCATLMNWSQSHSVPGMSSFVALGMMPRVRKVCFLIFFEWLIYQHYCEGYFLGVENASSCIVLPFFQKWVCSEIYPGTPNIHESKSVVSIGCLQMNVTAEFCCQESTCAACGFQQCRCLRKFWTRMDFLKKDGPWNR